MNNIHQRSIFHGSDCYELTFSGLTIKRLKVYCGESQMPREIKFLDLPPEVKALVVAEIKSTNNQNGHKETQPPI